MHIYDFDRSTGILSNHKKINIYPEEEIDPDRVLFSSVEWSPNGRFIYTASSIDLYQVDLYEEDIQADGVRLIDTWDGSKNPFSTKIFLMAQAPDCKIYICSTSSTDTYHVIHHPDDLGKDCTFVQHGLQLPHTSSVASMPNFPRFRVDDEDKCNPMISSVFGNTVYYRHHLELYPNPSTGIFNVMMPDGFQNGHMIITDVNGLVVHEQPIQQRSLHEEINISSLPHGYYNVELYPKENNNRIFYAEQVIKVD